MRLTFAITLLFLSFPFTFAKSTVLKVGEELAESDYSTDQHPTDTHRKADTAVNATGGTYVTHWVRAINSQWKDRRFRAQIQVFWNFTEPDIGHWRDCWSSIESISSYRARRARRSKYQGIEAKLEWREGKVYDMDKDDGSFIDGVVGWTAEASFNGDQADAVKWLNCVIEWEPVGQAGSAPTNQHYCVPSWRGC